MIYGICPVKWTYLKPGSMGKEKNLVPSKYVVDIGFEIREFASGGGAVLSAETMQILGKIGMDIYFSEYPSGTTE